MRILVLSRNAALYSTSRLVRAGRARGHQVDVIDPLQLQIAAMPKLPVILFAGQRLPRYRAVVPRIGASITRYGLAVVRQLEEPGPIVLNTSTAIALSRDKVRSLQLLARRRVRVPPTISVRLPAGVDAALELVGGCPVVVKLQHGTQGIGTMIAESRRALIPMLETLWAMGQDVILQQYVRESRGRDVRALVIGDRVIASMRRTAPAGEFRSNLHRGARGESVRLSRRYRATAVRAAQALGLTLCGVDMFETSAGPVVIELNSSPGLEGIELATESDVAGAVIDYLETLASETGANSETGAKRSRK